DLPRMTIGVQEHRAVAAPKRLSRLASDACAGRACLLHDRIDLLARSGVERQRHTAPPLGVLDAAVLGELRAIPQREHHLTSLKEHHVVALIGARRPAERLIKPAGTLQIAYAQGDHADSLGHPPNACRKPP